MLPRPLKVAVQVAERLAELVAEDVGLQVVAAVAVPQLQAVPREAEALQEH